MGSDSIKRLLYTLKEQIAPMLSKLLKVERFPNHDLKKTTQLKKKKSIPQSLILEPTYNASKRISSKQPLWCSLPTLFYILYMYQLTKSSQPSYEVLLLSFLPDEETVAQLWPKPRTPVSRDHALIPEIHCLPFQSCSLLKQESTTTK